MTAQHAQAATRTIGPVTTGATAGAAAALLIAWLLRLLLGVEMPAEVQGALAILLVAAGGYLVKPAAARTTGGQEGAP